MHDRQPELAHRLFDDGAVADDEDAERVRVDVLARDAADVLERHGLEARDVAGEVVVRQAEVDDVEQPPQNIIRIHLKYGPNGEKLIREIHRVSTPGRRVHHGVRDMHDVLHGLGISVLTTSRGVMSNREAKQAGIGGEVLCEVW